MNVVLEHPESWIVIPAFNEATAIEAVVTSLCHLGNVILVDDGSTDGTSDIIASLQRRFSNIASIRHPVNLGQGAALQTGICYALQVGAKCIVTYDADGQHSPESISALLAPLKNGVADVALGSRFLRGGGAENMPLGRRFVLACAVQFTRFCTGLDLTDTHNGLRAFSAHAASQFMLTQDRMAHATQLMMQIRAKKLSYVEVPVCVIYTSYSLQKGQKLRDLWKVFWDSVLEVLVLYSKSVRPSSLETENFRRLALQNAVHAKKETIFSNERLVCNQ